MGCLHWRRLCGDSAIYILEEDRRRSLFIYISFFLYTLYCHSCSLTPTILNISLWNFIYTLKSYIHSLIDSGGGLLLYVLSMGFIYGLSYGWRDWMLPHSGTRSLIYILSRVHWRCLSPLCIYCSYTMPPLSRPASLTIWMPYMLHSHSP